MIDDANQNNENGNYKINNKKATLGKFFEYKSNIIGSTPGDGNVLDTETVLPLKYLSNFSNSLDFLLTNCETELDLSRSKDCVISEILITTAVFADPNVNPHVQAVPATKTTSEILQINTTKISAATVTLSINNNISFLENIKQ